MADELERLWIAVLNASEAASRAKTRANRALAHYKQTTSPAARATFILQARRAVEEGNGWIKAMEPLIQALADEHVAEGAEVELPPTVVRNDKS